VKRYVSIWFPYLKTDWFSVRQPLLREVPFVLVVPDHGRKLISAANELAIQRSIHTGMVAADAKAIYPLLQVTDDEAGLSQRLLKRMAEWCIRFSPCVAVDGHDGLILDATGCSHLWGGDELYTAGIRKRFKNFGYTVSIAMADTIGCAWAVARFGNGKLKIENGEWGRENGELKIENGEWERERENGELKIENGEWERERENGEWIVESGKQANALMDLPAAALRLDEETVERLNKLGLRYVKDFIAMPKAALRRRFLNHPSSVRAGCGTEAQRNMKPGKSMVNGQWSIITRIDQALGLEEEFIQYVHEPSPYEERLPCLEPIVTATGIGIALQRLLESLCDRLKKEGKGIRTVLFKCYRIDGKTEEISIGTIRASHHAEHLFRLFALKIESIEPALGIELFILHATKVEDHSPLQEKLWNSDHGSMDEQIAELLDRLSCKIGIHAIHRYLPAEHYWPERSVKNVLSLNEKPTTHWKVERPRPLQLLARPEPIEVTAPVPDYPPMNFRYKGKLHTIKKADGPERIEQEWWIEEGQHRDYYYVEDEEGCRYWLFRLGHYEERYRWFVHGLFV
jgi:protein ImuB